MFVEIEKIRTKQFEDHRKEHKNIKFVIEVLSNKNPIKLTFFSHFPCNSRLQVESTLYDFKYDALCDGNDSLILLHLKLRRKHVRELPLRASSTKNCKKSFTRFHSLRDEENCISFLSHAYLSGKTFPFLTVAS